MQSELEKVLEEMINAGAGHRATPKRIIVSPTMFRAAEMILESNAAKNHEIKVDFND
jgi:hypothetical protein